METVQRFQPSPSRAQRHASSYSGQRPTASHSRHVEMGGFAGIRPSPGTSEPTRATSRGAARSGSQAVGAIVVLAEATRWVANTLSDGRIQLRQMAAAFNALACWGPGRAPAWRRHACVPLVTSHIPWPSLSSVAPNIGTCSVSSISHPGISHARSFVCTRTAKMHVSTEIPPGCPITYRQACCINRAPARVLCLGCVYGPRPALCTALGGTQRGLRPSWCLHVRPKALVGCHFHPIASHPVVACTWHTHVHTRTRTPSFQGGWSRVSPARLSSAQVWCREAKEGRLSFRPLRPRRTLAETWDRSTGSQAPRH